MNPVDVSELCQRLLKRYGAQGWWPADTPFEIIVGAFLVQRTNWQNADRALERLRDVGLIDLEGLSAARQEDIEVLIKPAGFPRQKAERIVEFSKHVRERYSNLDCFLSRPREELREKLLGLRGVGPETADVIILYAAGMPSFPASAYARRILGRLAESNLSYYQAKLLVESVLQQVGLQKELYALLIQHGKMHCHPKPKCDGCSLSDMCAFG